PPEAIVRFFSVMRLHPICTPFPYTTLFRSEETEIIEINASDWPILIANVSGDLDLLRLKDVAENLQDELESVAGVLRVGLSGGVDRKSTRLNSSHVKISYAVFCLQKNTEH